MTSHGVFTVSGVEYPDGVDPLGIWQMPTIEATPFSLGTADADSLAVEDVVIWQIQLPDKLEDATDIMQSQIQLADQQLDYLEEIASLLDALDPTQPTHMPYVIGSHNPQTVLLDSISGLHTPLAAYSIDDTAIDLRSLYERCEVIINRFKQVISHRGRIETRIGDNLVGLTKIDWSGDFESIWNENAAPQAMSVHMKSVRLASTSRLAVLRILTIAATGAMKLAVKASIPGGQFLLVPAVYKFIRDMLEELQNIPVEVQ